MVIERSGDAAADSLTVHAPLATEKVQEPPPGPLKFQTIVKGFCASALFMVAGMSFIMNDSRKCTALGLGAGAFFPVRIHNFQYSATLWTTIAWRRSRL